MVIQFPAPRDEPPPPDAPAARRTYPEDVPKVADNLIELRSLRMGLRRLDRYRLALDTRRVALEERLDRAEMRLVEVVRHLEMKKSA